MAKKQHTTNPVVQNLFNELEQYLQFCVDYGYKYDEATLFDMRSNAYRQFAKFKEGKSFRDRWAEDARAFGG